MSAKHLIADIPVKALILEQEKFLLVEERTPQSVWALPGGRLNEGEQPKDGLRREIQEELGVRIVVGPLVDCATFTSDSGMNHAVIVFEAVLAPGAKNVPTPDETEIKSVRWVTREEALRMPLREEYRRILERLSS